MNLLSFLSKEKKKIPAPPPLPSWSEAVSVMYNKQLNCFGDELVDVLYTPDKTKRFVLLKSDKGYFRFVYEELHPFTEEEWMYVSRGKNPVPAIWEPPAGWQGSSLFGTLEDTWKELKLSPEYKQYFKAADDRCGNCLQIWEEYIMSENYSAKRVPLEAVIGGIEMASDSYTVFLDLETMEHVSVADELMTGIADTETAEMIDANPGRFLRLPTQGEIHEYSIMENFVYSLEDGEAKQSLASAIQGRGAFRRFKDTLVQYGLRECWFDFRAAAYRELAIRWCRDHDLLYTENGVAHIEIQILCSSFSVCKVKDYSGVNLNSAFCFIGKTDEENSLVCLTEDVPGNTIEREDGWRAFRVSGVLDFSLIGILSRLSAILAEAGIGIFAVSTYNTDYILTKEKDFDKALDALTEAGIVIL